MTDLNTSGEHACFGGTVSFYEHHSAVCDAGLRFEHDASELVRRRPFADGRTILVDQGTADEVLGEQLYPGVLEVACREADQPLTLRWHGGYDHGYYFISTFMEITYATTPGH